jgi:hypothetical protein
MWGMGDRRKKAGVWSWAAAVIAMPVLYVALFGPACWIVGKVPARAGAVISFDLPGSRDPNRKCDPSGKCATLGLKIW